MTGLNLSQVKSLIIVPVLSAFPPRFARPVNLMLGTMLVESSGEFLTQAEDGPARGLFQMEIATYADCWSNFLRFPANADVLATVQSTVGSGQFSGSQAMCGNFYFACAMARVKYIRVAAALPDDNDAEALANYYKTYYNTAGGAASVAGAIPLFQTAIDTPLS